MSLIKNSLIISIARFFNRGLGLISTLIVARILSPDDYGVIAACMLAQDLGRRFSQLGVYQNLISSSDTSYQLQDSLYAQRILLSSLISLAIFLLAPYIAIVLKDARITAVLQILCWVFVINSVMNFNCLISAKDNNFKPELISLSASKVCQVAVTIGCAIYFQNYWALVAGIMTAAIMQTAFSYFVMQPYVMRSFSIGQIIHNLSYSKWFLGRELLDYFNAKLAQIVAGIYFSSTLLGFLSVGRDLCLMLALEVNAALDKSNLSHLSATIKNHHFSDIGNTVIENIKQLLFFKNVIVVPAYFCLFVHPELFIKLILGEGWLEMAPYCQVFASISILMSYNTIFSTIFDCVRKPQVIMVSTGFMFISTALFVYPAVTLNSPLLLVASTLFGIVINTVWYLYNLNKIFSISIRMLFDAVRSTLLLLFASIVTMYTLLVMINNSIMQIVSFLVIYLFLLFGVAVWCKEEHQLNAFKLLKRKLAGAK